MKKKMILKFIYWVTKFLTKILTQMKSEFYMWGSKCEVKSLIIISSSILLWNLILLIIFTIESTSFIITIETRRVCKNTINLKQIGSVLIF